ncbi:molybdopterin biosynthesis protein [Actinophytocola glycyrrhizae]|uniref:Molybdopterin molybdenumtransferase n=1 Tax=Actinophytocola glycyrrhizae TaxID=2044873 RepID=A0ABV9SBP1_9PSEU
MSAGSPFVSDVPAAQAHTAWREARAAAGCPPRVGVVGVPVGEAVGRVTAAPVWARRSSPAFDSSGMDGIAVRAADTVGAAETTPVLLTDFAVVDTGDPLPVGYDAVVMREHVHRVGDAAEVRAAVPPYQHVRSIGEDISTAELLLPEGHRLRPVDVAACAAAGVTELAVRRAPVVAVIPTGDEIRPIGATLEPGDILDTNSLMLAAQAREAGCEAHVTDIVRDDPSAITDAVRAGAATADLVLLIAGSSAGRDDYTARVVAGAGTLAVHGVAVRPGHPVVLGVVDATPVVGVPGYPVSAALTFDIFAAPLLAELEGAAPRERPSTTAHLARKLPSAIGMDDWVRVRLGRVRDRVVATPLPRGAGVLTSLMRADGLLVVPSGVEGHHAGEEVRVELLRGLGEIDRTIVAIGSHDLVLDLAASALRATDPLVTLASSNVGSLGGLVALRDGLCHLAGSHLLDPATGEYTLPYVDKLLGDDIAVIRLVHRDQGLIVAPGNPLELAKIDDLTRPGLRYVNRQRGAGTRVLLDHELARRDIDPADVPGYPREEHTHLAVAAAVAAGRADAGLGILAAARAFGLDFVPVTQEPYDLVLRTESLTDDRLAPLWTLLDAQAFRDEVESLGGYSCAETGRRVR